MIVREPHRRIRTTRKYAMKRSVRRRKKSARTRRATTVNPGRATTVNPRKTTPRRKKTHARRERSSSTHQQASILQNRIKISNHGLQLVDSFSKPPVVCDDSLHASVDFEHIHVIVAREKKKHRNCHIDMNFTQTSMTAQARPVVRKARPRPETD
jgi:hypothetical protein